MVTNVNFPSSFELGEARGVRKSSFLLLFLFCASVHVKDTREVAVKKATKMMQENPWFLYGKYFQAVNK